ncbi:FecR family protein [Methylotuvimicrobium alcaliphilum]|uniref:Anti-FecI sigma factor, FecR n=1 Tax=Methylotuvimicrobium alcaliphilum (strain DSM 19304 / NCIMB 14124 / VKM B-2133 / 20Z) TaxID=1091494 RepID=G4SYP1_META2|nr:FecR domain-containing protein [Methylotuvimicrobium alcaliphilum]CCE23227.1 Anti-FecI sigma factor, FecR [Methylotuvimicrobium alcaliphilum 20Z]
MGPNNNDSIDEQAVTWFVRLRADNVSRQERASFIQWLEQAAEHRTAFYEICVMWGDEAFLQSLTDSANKHGIVPKPKKKRRIKTAIPLALAACFVLAVSLSGQLHVLLNADYSARQGELKTVQLEDGTTVMLNTDSAVAVKMEAGQRLVELLKGEVYFDVKPDRSRPFLVKADRSTTRVLGTRFFVHRKSDSDEIKVLSGRVEVSESRYGKKPLILSNQESVTVYETTMGQLKKLDSKLTTSWINGVLVYENETLETVIDQINRYRFGVVYFRDERLRNLRINGRLRIKDSRDMLDVLQKTMDIKITYLTDWVVIVG